MSEDIVGCYKRDVVVSYWHLVGRDQRYYQVSYNAQNSSHNKELCGPECQQY